MIAMCSGHARGFELAAWLSVSVCPLSTSRSPNASLFSLSLLSSFLSLLSSLFFLALSRYGYPGMHNIVHCVYCDNLHPDSVSRSLRLCVCLCLYASLFLFRFLLLFLFLLSFSFLTARTQRFTVGLTEGFTARFTE